MKQNLLILLLLLAGWVQGQKVLHYTAKNTEGGLCDNVVNAMAIDRNDNKWFATDKGVSMFDGKKWTSYRNIRGLKNERFKNICVDKQNNIWVSKESSISYFNGKKWKTIQIFKTKNDEIGKIAVNSIGEIFISSLNGFLLKITHAEAGNKIDTIRVFQDQITNFQLDFLDRLWISTREGDSLFVFNKNQWSFFTSENLPGNHSYCEITYITNYTVNGVLIMCNNELLLYQENKWRKLEYYRNDSPDNFCVDENENIWNFDGHMFILNNSKYFPVDNKDVSTVNTSVYVDKNNNKWVCGKGVYELANYSNTTIFTDCNTSAGICNNTVTTFLIDSNNNKWFGTANGISRYDNKKWTTYTKSDGLIGNTINLLKQDSKGVIWASSCDYDAHIGGLSKFVNGKWVSILKNQGYSDYYIPQFIFDNKNNIWIALDYSEYTWRLLKIKDSICVEYSRKNGLAFDRISYLSVDSIGNAIVFGKKDRLPIKMVYNGNSWESVPYIRIDKNGVQLQFNNNSWDTIRYDRKYESERKKQYIKNGKYILKGSPFMTLGETHYIDSDEREGLNAFYSATVDAENNLWASYDDGIWKYENNKWNKVFPIVNCSNQLQYELKFLITDIQEDAKKCIWATSKTDGAIKYENGKFANYKVNSLPNNEIVGVVIDKNGNKWIGTKLGLTKFDGLKWVIDTALKYNVIKSIIKDFRGNIWVYGKTCRYDSTFEGLSKFDGKRWTYFQLSNNLKDVNRIIMSSDSLNNIWVGTDKGLYKFADEKWSSIINNERSWNNIYSIFNDSNNRIWVGTDSGMVVYDNMIYKSYTMWHLFENKYSGYWKEKFYVYSIIRDRNNVVWAATSLGLLNFNGLKWEEVNTNEIINSNRYSDFSIDIVKNDNLNRIWVVCQSGLYLKDGDNWINYSQNLPKANITSIEFDSDNNLWVGTDKGLSKITLSK